MTQHIQRDGSVKKDEWDKTIRDGITYSEDWDRHTVKAGLIYTME